MIKKDIKCNLGKLEVLTIFGRRLLIGKFILDVYGKRNFGGGR